MPRRHALQVRAGAAAELPPPTVLAHVMLHPPRRKGAASATQPPRKQQEDTWILEDEAGDGWTSDEVKEHGRRWGAGRGAGGGGGGAPASPSKLLPVVSSREMRAAAAVRLASLLVD